MCFLVRTLFEIFVSITIIFLFKKSVNLSFYKILKEEMNNKCYAPNQITSTHHAHSSARLHMYLRSGLRSYMSLDLTLSLHAGHQVNLPRRLKYPQWINWRDIFMNWLIWRVNFMSIQLPHPTVLIVYKYLSFGKRQR